MQKWKDCVPEKLPDTAYAGSKQHLNPRNNNYFPTQVLHKTRTALINIGKEKLEVTTQLPLLRQAAELLP